MNINLHRTRDESILRILAVFFVLSLIDKNRAKDTLTHTQTPFVAMRNKTNVIETRRKQRNKKNKHIASESHHTT